MLDVASDLKGGRGPDEICLLGDFADFYSIQSHAKNPEKAGVLFAYEKDVVNEKLDELDTLFPRASKVYIEGNHEYRLARYIRDNAPALYGVVNCETEFNLKKRPRWKWIPYGPYQRHKILGSKLIARHEPLGGGQNHSGLTATKAMASIIYGHVHQIQETQKVAFDGANYRAFCPGWLGDYRVETFHYVKNHAQWSLGFAVVTVLENRNWFANICHVIEYQTVFGGRLYSR